jgi:hypothetical protein
MASPLAALGDFRASHPALDVVEDAPVERKLAEASAVIRALCDSDAVDPEVLSTVCCNMAARALQSTDAVGVRVVGREPVQRVGHLREPDRRSVPHGLREAAARHRRSRDDGVLGEPGSGVLGRRRCIARR